MMDISKIARTCVMDLKEYVPGKPIEEVKCELGLDDVLKMASNENPLGSSPIAIEAIKRELENCYLYPEGPCTELAGRLAKLFELDTRQFFINNGVDGVLSMTGLAFVDPGDEVVASEFSFAAYKNLTVRMNGKIILVPQTPDRRIDIDGMIAAITPKTKMVFLCNPNNPTGTIITRYEFERLLAAVPENTLLISDEAYYEFVDDPAYPQTLPYLKDHPNLVILRTFSKVMGLAGLRVGYAIAHPDVIKALNKVKDPFPVNRLAQAAASASLDDYEFVRRSTEVVRKGREQLYDELLKFGLIPTRSQANFVLVDLGRNATPVFESMLCDGVIVRPLEPQGLPNCLRITVGTTEQNNRALAALAKALKN